MKNNPNPVLRLTAALGAAALVLRTILYLAGRDGKGLLIPGHPLNILIWAVTGAAVVLVSLAVRPLDGSRKYSDNFGPSSSAAMGCFAMAGGIALSILSGWQVWTRLELVRNLCGLASVPALVVLGLHRRKGKQPFFLFHGMVCLYLILYAVSHYQAWSSRPQLQDYFFCMVGSILLCLFAYQQTAFDVSLGKRRMQLFTGLLTGFFCLAALAGGEDLLLYLGGAVWALTGLCRLTPVPRRRRNPITEGQQENSHEAS